MMRNQKVRLYLKKNRHINRLDLSDGLHQKKERLKLQIEGVLTL